MKTVPVLEVRNLKTYYIKKNKLIRSVDDISFTIAAYERVGIAGESGSGKTQTALTVMGLNENTPGLVAGQIVVNGQHLTAGLEQMCHVEDNGHDVLVKKNCHGWQTVFESRIRDLRGSVISMIFQEPKGSLSPYFTIREQIFETLGRNNLVADQKQTLAESVVPLFLQLKFSDPERILNAYPHELSGGESQRIMLALALLTQPRLLIADEPTTLLDAITQHHVVDLLDLVLTDRRISLLFITHNLSIVSYLVEYVLIMFAGKILEKGPVREVMKRRNDHHHPYTQALLDAFSRQPGGNGGRTVATRQNERGCRYFFRCPIKESLTIEMKQRCQGEEPPLIELGTNHWVACWVKE